MGVSDNETVFICDSIFLSGINQLVFLKKPQRQNAQFVAATSSSAQTKPATVPGTGTVPGTVRDQVVSIQISIPVRW